VEQLQRAPSTESPESLEGTWQTVLLEKQSQVAAEFDQVHTVERACAVGSLDAIVEPAAMRFELIRELRESGS
jgi:hypothetical protein